MRPHISAEEAHRIAFGLSPPDDSYFATRLSDGLGDWGARPAGQGQSESSAPGKQQIRSASGHAAASPRPFVYRLSLLECEAIRWRLRVDCRQTVMNYGLKVVLGVFRTAKCS